MRSLSPAIFPARPSCLRCNLAPRPLRRRFCCLLTHSDDACSIVLVSLVGWGTTPAHLAQILTSTAHIARAMQDGDWCS